MCYLGLLTKRCFVVFFESDGRVVDEDLDLKLLLLKILRESGHRIGAVNVQLMEPKLSGGIITELSDHLK